MYSPDTDQNNLNPDILPVQTAQIISGALIAGVLVFMAIVFTTGMAPDPPAGQLLSLIGVVMGISSIFGRIVILKVLSVPPTSLNMDGVDTSELSDVNRRALSLFGIYQTQMIIGLALLEGAAFFNCVAYMQEGNVWSLGVVGGLVVIMLLSFPTRARVAFWIENKLQYEDSER